MGRSQLRPGCLALATLVTAIALAACGDDGDGGGDGGDTVASGDPTRLRFYDWEPNLVTGPVGRPDIAESECPEPRCVVVEEGGAYFALRDQPALTGEEIVDPELSADPVSGDPAISFDFTEAGADSFERLTRAVAQRGQGHFAIVAGDHVLSRPTIDSGVSPEGIDGSNGASISGGLTQEQAQELVELLASDDQG